MQPTAANAFELGLFAWHHLNRRAYQLLVLLALVPRSSLCAICLAQHGSDAQHTDVQSGPTHRLTRGDRSGARIGGS